MENYIFIMTIHTKINEVFRCKKTKTNKLKLTERQKKIVNNDVKVSNENESAGCNIRKLVQVKILNKNIKLQLDSGPDLSIINVCTWNKIGGICYSPHLTSKYGTRLFLGGTGRRAVAHTCPEFPKMPSAPSAFPLLGAPQAPGN